MIELNIEAGEVKSRQWSATHSHMVQAYLTADFDVRLSRLRALAVAFGLAISLLGRLSVGRPPESRDAKTSVEPRELPEAVLHNPDMGWVLYENYALDQDPHGSSTLVTLPEEKFTGVDTVALMFSWQDVERQPDQYDFSKIDFAYDYWTQRGKASQLRMSATSLMWWANRTPPAGKGAPGYVREHLSSSEKQSRTLDGVHYDVEDIGNAYYLERLARFLRAVDAHFSDARPVTLVDLRGFGLWGEWHSGFKHQDLEQRREALKKVVDAWCDSLPHRPLALSASYDPDGPKELYEGGTHEFEEKFTSHYQDFLSYSAFDYALTKPDITFRRDGCGGAVHSNERKLIEQAFGAGRGPIFAEFVDGYSQSKVGGEKWLRWKIDDALSLHPNYVNLLGWQAGDALTFMREQPELVEFGMRKMGYRFVPVSVSYPAATKTGAELELQAEWVNRGVGRPLRDYEFVAELVRPDKSAAAKANGGVLPTREWVANEKYTTDISLKFADAATGEYDLAIGLFDRQTARAIELPLENRTSSGLYQIGKISIR